MGKNVLRFRNLNELVFLSDSVRCLVCDLGNEKAVESQERNTQSITGCAAALKGHRWYLQTSQARMKPHIPLVDERGVEEKQNSSPSSWCGGFCLESTDLTYKVCAFINCCLNDYFL